ncbi:Ter macrodomain-binding protein MatP [Photobacterium carnosum]|uniref:Ter macrodomain-binding protein MatP n=1 Tax=Photobacterium carnosum TaxID=2023717 RepID=A0A2N4UW42_9GAMM|nr:MULTISPECIES: Ter macrodomain-binding protein MatP [Photobacterium]MCD9475833.1 Ter macrodomain-binding protein MatP [Photobacterium phosphoreum]MCD9485884.1 Ter macrodomain-binding protein MatP [Photobacterium iliopiscarium]MCD9507695.1 Ter macrodomain-binding protein MatP [Photobacterium phosphoreum]MCD9538184.1 Ter macrodomain-binding protein MatP [Photobacterium carnosum]MCD9542988.1 Ter macrodomain-binding protein MatP [Photobacterium carnosum]
MSKYQQLENLECGWKWNYLTNKILTGCNVTKWIDSSEIESSVAKLKAMESEPVNVLDWIIGNLNQEHERKLNQAIRAKRKRHFNAEQRHTKKKSVDLDYAVWQKLSERSQSLGATLSETIELLIEDKDTGSL